MRNSDRSDDFSNIKTAHTVKGIISDSPQKFFDDIIKIGRAINIAVGGANLCKNLDGNLKTWTRCQDFSSPWQMKIAIAHLILKIQGLSFTCKPDSNKRKKLYLANEEGNILAVSKLNHITKAYYRFLLLHSTFFWEYYWYKRNKNE